MRKKSIIKNFSSFTGKHLCCGVFFNKVTGLLASSFNKKIVHHRFLHVNIRKFLRTLILKCRPWKWHLLMPFNEWSHILHTGKSKESITKLFYSTGHMVHLSKVFDCILNDLLIAKLVAYGFDYQSLRIIESFLSNRQQITKINNAFSRYSEIIYGVPQGSILGPLLFNIYICDIFFDILECDIASHAEDNTAYNFDFNLDNVITKLEKSTNSLLNWFRANYMKAINVIS